VHALDHILRAVHPVHLALVEAAAGRFPPVDGAVEVHSPDEAGTHAVVELTGHSFVLTDRLLPDVVGQGADGFGGAVQPDVLRWLAGSSGWIGSHDVVLVARGRGGRERAAVRTDLSDHPRVARALDHRRDVEVFGDDAGVVILGRGLFGRREVSVELFEPSSGGQGRGRQLVAMGLDCADAGELVWAQVAPGNAASLRAFLAVGFVPIGAEVLLHPS
jgi:hypothetical protein